MAGEVEPRRELDRSTDASEAEALSNRREDNQDAEQGAPSFGSPAGPSRSTTCPAGGAPARAPSQSRGGRGFSPLDLAPPGRVRPRRAEQVDPESLRLATGSSASTQATSTGCSRRRRWRRLRRGA